MEICFEDQALARTCSERKLRVRAWGPAGAKKVALRLQQLQAAGSLQDMRNLPGRCHELAGDRAGSFAVDVQHPLRMVFRPTKSRPPRKPDGGLDWACIDQITIIEIIDYH